MEEPKTTTDELARIINKGFDEVTKGMNVQFTAVNKRLDSLEQGQEDIKLRLDNVAYRFELVELQHRVELLEKKVGIVRK